MTGDTVRAVCLLHVAPDQRSFVAPNAVSFAEAMFEPKACFRAVVADDVPVGFVMLAIDDVTPEYYLSTSATRAAATAERRSSRSWSTSVPFRTRVNC